jgi:toxin-antitoxin system PIN domain toxin
MTSLLLPDVNVWVALHHEQHAHHTTAVAWFDRLNPEQILVFCRQTQLGFFRLLTTPAVMGDETISQRQCWALYEEWLGGGRAVEQPEPTDLGERFRNRTMASVGAPKVWMDAYLAAFAEAGGFALITLDKALAGKVKGGVLLG